MISPKSSVKAERTRSTEYWEPSQDAIIFALISYRSFAAASMASGTFATGPYFAVTALIISGVVSPSVAADVSGNNRAISRTVSDCAVVPGDVGGHQVTS